MATESEGSSMNIVYYVGFVELHPVGAKSKTYILNIRRKVTTGAMASYYFN